MEEVTNTTIAIETSPRSTVDLPLPDSPILSPAAPIVPTEPKDPKSTQTLQKPSNPRRRLSEPLIEALAET